jgi:hypothetical protein
MLLKEFEKRWLAVFAEGVSKQRLEECMRCGHYIWHVFSYELLPAEDYLEGDAAREAYDSLLVGERKNALFIKPFAGKKPETFSLKYKDSGAEQLNQRTEIYAVAKDFSWTYIKTHEDGWCGPYFCRKKKS